MPWAVGPPETRCQLAVMAPATATVTATVDDDDDEDTKKPTLPALPAMAAAAELSGRNPDQEGRVDTEEGPLKLVTSGIPEDSKT